MQQEYSKMNPITEISGREDVLRKMNEIRVARNIQIENE